MTAEARRDHRFGAVALDLGLVRPEHLDEALQAQARGDPRAVAEILVARGRLGEEARSAALAEQERRLGSGALGRLAVLYGYCDRGALDRGLREQERLRESGDEARLGTILVRWGCLGERELEDLLSLQEGVRSPSRPDTEPTAAGGDRGLDEAEPRVGTEAGGASTAARWPPAPGDRIGPLELVRRLGVGGMGMVYLARNRPLDRLEVLKVMRPDEALDPRVVERFLDEARQTAQVVHPAVAPIHEVLEAGERSYYRRAYVEGTTLREVQAGNAGGIPPGRQSLRWLAQVASALSAAHAHGIVHRDVKPENVIIDAEGQARLIDFGLAVEEEARLRLSATGTGGGTLPYMAPEQLEGRPTAATDVWALGVILVELLTGRNPFVGPGATEATVQWAILQGPLPRPRPRVEGLDGRDLATMVGAALEREPRERYRVEGMGPAAAFAEDCRRVLVGEPLMVRKASLARRARRSLRRHPGVAAAVLGTAFLAAAAASLSAKAHWDRRQAALREFDRVRDLGERGRSPQAVQGALEVYDRAIREDPLFARAWYYRGRALLRLGRHALAQEALDEAARLDPADPAPSFYAGVTRLRRFQALADLHDRQADHPALDPFGLHADGPPRDRVYQEAMALHREALASFDEAVRRAPGGAHALVGRAYADLVRREAPGQVLPLCGQALALDPVFGEAHFLEAAIRGGLDLGGMGRGDGLGSADFDADLRRGRDLGAALEAVGRYLDLDPLSTDGRFLEAGLHWQRRDAERARAALERVLSLDPDHEGALDLRSRLSMRPGGYEDALVDLARLVRLRGEDRRLVVLRAAALMGLGRYGEVDAFLGERLGRTTEVRSLYVLRLIRSGARALRGDGQGSREDFHAALAADPAHSRWAAEGPRLWLAAEAVLGSSLALALRDTPEVLGLEPSRKASVLRLEALLELPAVREALGRPLERGQVDLELRLVAQALDQFDRERAGEALAAWREATGLEGGVMEFLTLLGYYLAMDDEQVLLAQGDLYSTEDYLRRASAHYRKGRHAEAAEDLRRALRLDPTSRRVHYAAATVSALRAREDASHLERALRHLQGAVVLGFRHLDWTEADPDFEAVRDTEEFRRLRELVR